MTKSDYWDLIDKARLSVRHLTDVPAQLARMLVPLPQIEIVEFERWLRQSLRDSYDARLWAAACLMLRFCSDDKFYDFRGWLVAHGGETFDRALVDPDSLSELESNTGDDQQPMLFKLAQVAQEAYRQKTGGNDIAEMLPPWPASPLLNEGVWDGDKKKLAAMYPRLFAKYGGVAL